MRQLMRTMARSKKNSKRGGTPPAREDEVRALRERLKRLAVVVQSKANGPRFQGKGSYQQGAVFTGHGGYKQKLVRSLKSAGKSVGRVALAEGKRQAIGLISGSGSYGDATVTNELMNLSDPNAHIKTVPMRFKTRRDDETDILIVTAREYIGDLLGPVTPFDVQSYFLNPGLSAVAAKLAQTGANFDMHRPRRIVVVYHSTTTDIGSSTNGQCGVVIIAGSSNATLPEYTSKRAMMDAKGAVSAKTTENCLYGFECEPEKGGAGWLYVRHSSVPEGQDQKTYDAGVIQIAVSNSPSGFANQQIGELYIDYEWELKDNNLRSALGWVIPRDIFVTPVTGATATWGAFFGVTPATAVVYAGADNSIGSLLTPTVNGCTVTLPSNFEGGLCLHLEVTGTTGAGAAATPQVIGTSGNFLRVNDMYAYTGVSTWLSQSNPVPVSGQGSNGQGRITTIAHWYVTPPAQGTNNVITLTPGTFGTGTVYSYLELTQYPTFGLVNNTPGGTTAGSPNLLNLLTGLETSGVTI